MNATSAIEEAIGKFQDVIAQEKSEDDAQHKADRARYVELLLSGDDTPETAAELARLLHFLADAHPPVTPESVRADVQAIAEARRFIGLAGVLEHAKAETSQHTGLLHEAEYVSSVWPKHERRLQGAALEHRVQCERASAELAAIATRHPEFFEFAEDGTPRLKGADAAAIVAEAQQARTVEWLVWRIRLNTKALVELNDTLSNPTGYAAQNGRARAGYEAWRAIRDADQKRLVAELEAVTGKPCDPSLLTINDRPPAQPASPGDESPQDAGDVELESPAGFVSNQQQAAAAVGVSEDEWNLLKQEEGFPQRSAKGWDVQAIRTWLAATPAATEDAD